MRREAKQVEPAALPCVPDHRYPVGRDPFDTSPSTGDPCLIHQRKDSLRRCGIGGKLAHIQGCRAMFQLSAPLITAADQNRAIVELFKR